MTLLKIYVNDVSQVSTLLKQGMRFTAEIAENFYHDKLPTLDFKL